MQQAATSSKKSFKVVVLGAASVGKTSLSTQYVEGVFTKPKSTIAAAFHTKSVRVGSSTIALQIWDTAGQEKFKSLTPMYYRDCAAALVVYDLNEPETLSTAQYWVEELRKKEHPYCIILIGNKCDLVDDMSSAESIGRHWAQQEGLPYFSASAKTRVGVADMFQTIIDALPTTDDKAPKPSAAGAAHGDVIVVGNRGATDDKGCPC